MQTEQENDIMSYAQAAKWLGVPVGTLYCWVYQRKVPHFRLGPRTVRFSRFALTSWLQTNQVNSLLCESDSDCVMAAS